MRGSLAARRITGFGWHIFGIAITYFLAFLLRFDFSLKFPEPFNHAFWATLPIVLGIHLIVIIAFGLYRGLWTFFSFADCIKNLVAFGIGTIGLAGVVFIWALLLRGR